LKTAEKKLRSAAQDPVPIMKPRMATMMAMVSQEPTARTAPTALCSAFQRPSRQRCHIRKYTMTRPTSLMNTSHSMNQAQKKTRMRLPMPKGAMRAAVSQIPTPVRAPKVVVMMNRTKVIL